LIALIFEVGDEEVISLTLRADANGARYIAEVIGVGRGDRGTGLSTGKTTLSSAP
jgi:hypothetical protein